MSVQRGNPWNVRMFVMHIWAWECVKWHDEWGEKNCLRGGKIRILHV